MVFLQYPYLKYFGWARLDELGTFFEINQMPVQQRCQKVLFSHRVISKWNMLDDVTVTARTVNGFKSKLEKERTKKMGLLMD